GMRSVSASMCGSSASYAYGRSGSAKAISGAPFGCCAALRRRICSALVSTLVYRFEEIAPRPLREEVLELDGISRASVEAHYKLYEGYVAKRNEILGRLADVDLGAANQVFSEVRALKVDLSSAVGGTNNPTPH